MTLGERVKKIREDLGKTQKEMAGLVDVGLRTWQQYEENVHDPSWKVVSQLVELGYNATWLASEEGEMRTAVPIFQVGHHSGPVSIKGTVGEKRIEYTTRPDLKWFHEWVDEELEGKSVSAIMAIAVKIKTVLDDNKGG
jgi:transcriptional regulator with XRE-family HTH domain